MMTEIQKKKEKKRNSSVLHIYYHRLVDEDLHKTANFNIANRKNNRNRAKLNFKFVSS